MFRIESGALLLLVIIFAGCQGSSKSDPFPMSSKGAATPEIYHLPQGFTGWVMVKYGFKECPSLKQEKGSWVFEVPTNGVVCTSSYTEGGWVRPMFFNGAEKEALAWTTPGKGGFVWDGGQGGFGEDRTKSYQVYFIGPEKEYLARVNDERLGKSAFIRANW